MSNPLWEYSCTIYACEGVSEACLQLQDSFDFDVNLLLYGAWLGALGCELSLGQLAKLDALIAPWREDVIKPLRSLRRELKAMPHMAASGEDVQALELGAERQQQNVMYDFFQRCSPQRNVRCSQGQNLATVGRYQCPYTMAWREDMERLAALIGG